MIICALFKMEVMGLMISKDEIHYLRISELSLEAVFKENAGCDKAESECINMHRVDGIEKCT